MKANKHNIFTLTILLLISHVSNAGNYTWTGTTNTDWATGTNWNPNGVPSTNDTVTVVTHTNLPLLAANTTIKKFTMTSGTLDCNGLTLTISSSSTFNGGTINNGTLTCSGTSTLTFAGTTFGVAVNATGNNILFNGSVFNSTLNAVKKGTSNDNGTGGNVFNGSVTLTDSSSGNLVLSNNSSSPDTFNAALTVASRSSGSIYLAHQGTGNVFAGKVAMNSSSSGKIYSNYYGTAAYNDSIIVNSTSSGGETFGASTGSCTLASGKTIAIGSEGFDHTASGGSFGTLYLRNFVQNGTASINLTLTGTRATIKFEEGSSFGGTVTISAPGIFLDGSRFLSKANLTYTSGSGYTLTSSGGNYFADSVSVIQNNSGTVTMAGTAVDTFSTYAVLQNTSTSFSINNALFQGNVKFKNALSSQTEHYWVASSGTVTIKGTATIENANSAITFGGSGGTTVLDTNCRITIPAGSGIVRLSNVVQHGSDTISIPMSASTDILYLKTGNLFNGPFIFKGQRIFLNGTTFNGSVNILRTNATTDACDGGNVFNGNTVICDSVSTSNSNRSFQLATVNPDDFNGNVTFKQYGSGTGGSTVRLYPAYTKNSTFAGNITVDGNSAIEFGANGGKVIIDGNGNQNISKTGSYNPSLKKLELQNSGATCTLNLPLSISDSIIFNSGYLATDTTNLLTVPDNCIVTGASDYSLVVGPVKKIGNDAFTFPLGGPWTEAPPIYAVPNNVYHPLSITAPANSGDAYTAKYFHANHGFGTNSDSTLELPSTTEYWKLDRNAGSDSVYATLGWGWNSSNTTQLLGMKVAEWNGSIWKDFDNGGTTGNSTNGTVKTSALIGAFGYFTTANVHCYLTIDVGTDQFIFDDSTATIGVSPAASHGYTPNTYLWSTGATTETVSGVATGSYSLIVTDSKGCVRSGQVNVNGPSTVVTVYNCEDVPITYNGGTSGINNCWDFGDGSAATCTTATSITHVFTDPGYYSVSLTSNGLTFIRTIFILPSSTSPPYNPSCCINTFNSYTYDTYNLTSNTTWNGGTKYIKGTFTIKSGYTLTINGGAVVQFGPLGKIVVERQAQLNIDGASLKALQLSGGCQMMWPGIEVWGESSSALASHQGKIVLSNGALIEDAYNGIMLGRTKLLRTTYPGFQYNGHYSDYGGGIIQADDSYFNRCGVAIWFWEYPHSKGPANSPWDHITNCIFNCKNSSGVNDVLLDPYCPLGSAIGNYASTAMLTNHNPFYLWSVSQIGRSSAGIFLNKVRTINIIDNTFNYLEEGVHSNDSKVKIIKGSGSGNHFTHDVYWAVGISNVTTNIFGSTISYNSFDAQNWTFGHYGGVFGIGISYNKFDLIKNNSISSTEGIILNNTTNFNIADNSFSNERYSIECTSSGTAFSSIGYIAQGNIFTNCSLAVYTEYINDLLSIRCNYFNNGNIGNWIGRNWDITPLGTGSLPDQGRPAINIMDISAPAGNRFQIYSPLTNQIACYSSTSPLFDYYHHLDPIAVPVNYSGTLNGMTPVPDVVNLPIDLDDACAPPCPNPPSCLQALIETESSNLVELNEENSALESTIDGGQTEDLLEAISSEEIDNVTLRTMLIDDSPLSEIVLTAMFDHRDSMTSSEFTDILIPNSPVSKNLKSYLEIKLADLDTVDEDTVSLLQVYNPNYRTLTAIRRDINSNEMERQQAINSLVCHYLDSDSVSEAITLLESETNIESKQALVGTYVLLEDYTAASEKLETLPLETAEDTAYYDLYNIYIELGNEGKTIWDMDSSQLARVRQIAAMCPLTIATGNAQEALKIAFGDKFDTCDVEEGSRIAHNDNNHFQDFNYKLNGENLGNNIPNPFTGITYIPYSLPKGSTGIINIYGITGELVRSYVLKESENLLEVYLGDCSNGLYLCYLNIDNGKIIQRSKLILNK